ncbi:MAG: hypothetical protein DI598_12090 [Pseudopedobacter saltans]|uniref:S9 family peptidase n=1 Tax=Pseudopedobacter saltans TaxID=151895 RepID=A0A2W5GKX4_9SPHI|nr:MAG: hypothetical protein DI598_12090 [Pseudopedobacter saltans]
MKNCLTILFSTCFFCIKSLYAQQPSLEEISNYQTITELASSESNGNLSWASAYKGNRNLYVAKYPNYNAEAVTFFTEKEEQEISNIQLSKDGKYVVFVRGGDHGGYLYKTPNNALSYPETPTITIWRTELSTNKTIPLAEGDKPSISPDGTKVSFIKNGEIWSVSIDGGPTKMLVHSLGKCSDIQWSPDSSAIAFVSNRQGHSFVGIYKSPNVPIEWIEPSVFVDASPR